LKLPTKKKDSRMGRISLCVSNFDSQNFVCIKLI
jgi:hypothetical protein